ncbi:MAG: glycosyl hydrolase [Syntrophomonadaceae bacterium]
MHRNSILISLVLILGLTIIPVSGARADTYITNGRIASSADFNPSDDYKVVQTRPEGGSRLLDYSNGYSVDYPGDMWVDATISAVRVTLANNDTRVEIYYDNFYDTISNTSDYIGYSNLFLNNRDVYAKELDTYIKVNGLRTHLLQWSRDPLSTVPGDRCNYLSAEIVKNSYEVYTILVKTSGDPAQYLPLIKSFKLIERQGTPGINTCYTQTDRVSRLNAETQAFYKDYFSSSATLKWGIYEYSVGDNLNLVKSLEQQLGSPFHVLVWYKSLGTPLPRDILDRAYQDKKYVELTFHTEVAGADNRSVMYDILNGQYDEYFTTYARGLKDFGHPVLFRLDNEMNGDWCSWSSWRSSKDTEIFKAVWRHIYKVFETNGVDNVLWVWNPNDISFPGFKWNHHLTYFPGVQYVDIVGMTGYNTGTHFSGEYWRTFDSIYQPLYSEYSQVYGYPYMITEFACSSIGGDKEAWINDMFNQVKQYPNIKVANWFNGIDFDSAGQPGRIYRLDEDPTYIAAFGQGMSGSPDRAAK